MKMKADDKAKWLEALRSGKYAQCASILHDKMGGGYCCLGVLEELLDGKVEVAETGDPLAMPTCDFLARHGIEVETREGATNAQYPSLNYSGVYATLMELNDSFKIDESDGEELEGHHANTFTDIANYIEKNVETY